MHNLDLKHPSSLKVFFATEMWERYGFYVVQTLLALFLSLHFHWSDERVYALVGSFTALTYVSPVIGGWIADYLLGQKRAILAGAVILLFCYVALVIVAGKHDMTDAASCGLTLSLAGIAVGTGLLKPNISSLLGNEYHEDSERRESGFTIFYMGITSGIILGSTVPEVLNYHYGWPCSFISAAFGMLIAIVVFLFGVYRYRIADYTPYQHQAKKVVLACLLMFFMGSGAFYILQYPALANKVFICIAILSLSYFIYSAVNEVSLPNARRIWVICLLCIISVIFWAFYFQMFLSLTLFITRIVQPTLLGMQFPAPYYVSIQSIGALIFGYFMAQMKSRPTATQRGIHSANKFFLAIVFMTVAYLLIDAICHWTPTDQTITPILIIPTYLLISLAELCLYPVGLAAVTVLADRHKVSTLMGIFFVSLGLGGFLSGKLANLTAIAPDELSIAVIKAHYAHSFNQLVLILLASLLLCGILNRWIKRLLLSTNAASDASVIR